MSIPEIGTVVTAKPHRLEEARANNKLRYPDPRLPTYEGAPYTVTGPLEARLVEAPWGTYTIYSVGEYDIDVDSIQPWHAVPGSEDPGGEMEMAELGRHSAESQSGETAKKPARFSVIKQFVDEEAAFRDWTGTHPRGYVLNRARKDFMLHYGSCSHLTSKHDDLRFSARAKWCSDDKQELRGLAFSAANRSPEVCRSCNPL